MKILFLSSWFPFPPNNGSKIRVYNLLRSLARRHEVTLLTFSEKIEGSAINGLKPYCHIAGIVPKKFFRPRSFRALLGFLSLTPRAWVDTYSPQMARLTGAELAKQGYQVVIASEITTALYAAKTQGIPNIFDDVEMTILRDRYLQAPSLLYRFRHYLTWKKDHLYMRRLVSRFLAATVVSDREQANLREMLPDYDRIAVIPNSVDLEWLRPMGIEPHPKALVFNGSLTFEANYDAIAFFLSNIWPSIKAEEPDVSLTITGRTDGVSLERLPLGNDVTLAGHLQDIRPTVAAAWACIVPLRIGGGTRLKILEAMALGTPIIATKKGAEGLDVTPGLNILMADDPRQFAVETVRLLRNPNLRRRLSEAGRQLVEKKYSARSIGDQFTEFVESVVMDRVSPDNAP